jgi:hypothetical protein
MNYILPENFDFYKELNNSLEKDNTKTNTDICLISNTKLEKNNTVKLKCGHTFNYLPLLNDIHQSKHPSNNTYYNVYNIRFNQIRCPYCRQVQDALLPYFPDVDKKKIRGVNYPLKFGMGENKCTYIFKSGKSKGEMCGKQCYREKCHLHYKPQQNSLDYSKIERTSEALNKYNMTNLRSIAKYYKLKGISKLKKNDLINTIVNI